MGGLITWVGMAWQSIGGLLWRVVRGAWSDAPALRRRKEGSGEPLIGIKMTDAKCVDLVVKDLERWWEQVMKFGGWCKGLYGEKKR
jgi:hypothetical protein